MSDIMPTAPTTFHSKFENGTFLFAVCNLNTVCSNKKKQKRKEILFKGIGFSYRQIMYNTKVHEGIITFPSFVGNSW